MPSDDGPNASSSVSNGMDSGWTLDPLSLVVLRHLPDFRSSRLTVTASCDMSFLSRIVLF